MTGPCSPGCAGWFIQPAGERYAGTIMRCDECARFEDDEAAEVYVNTVVRARNAAAREGLHVHECGECGTTLDPSPVAQLTGTTGCPTCTERDRLRDERDTQLNEERETDATD